MWRINKINEFRLTKIEESQQELENFKLNKTENKEQELSRLKSDLRFQFFSQQKSLTDYVNTYLKTEDELSVCAAGLFAVRAYQPESNFVEQPVQLHPFAEKMVGLIVEKCGSLFNFCSNPRYKGYRGKIPQVLMIKEKRNNGWAYNFIGGKRDHFEENSLECALREFKEEVHDFGSFSQSFHKQFSEHRHQFGARKVLHVGHSRYSLYSYNLPEDSIAFAENKEAEQCELRWVSLRTLQNLVSVPEEKMMQNKSEKKSFVKVVKETDKLINKRFFDQFKDPVVRQFAQETLADSIRMSMITIRGFQMGRKAQLISKN